MSRFKGQFFELYADGEMVIGDQATITARRAGRFAVADGHAEAIDDDPELSQVEARQQEQPAEKKTRLESESVEALALELQKGRDREVILDILAIKLKDRIPQEIVSVAEPVMEEAEPVKEEPVVVEEKAPKAVRTMSNALVEEDVSTVVPTLRVTVPEVPLSIETTPEVTSKWPAVVIGGLASPAVFLSIEAISYLLS